MRLVHVECRPLPRQFREAGSNLLKLSVTDGFFLCFKAWMVTVIVSSIVSATSTLRPLPYRCRLTSSEADAAHQNWTRSHESKINSGLGKSALLSNVLVAEAKPLFQD